jgi:hypothetical protein
MLVLPLLLALSALGVDGANLFVQKRATQNVADAVAHAIGTDLDGGGTGCVMAEYIPNQDLHSSMTNSQLTAVLDDSAPPVKVKDYIRIGSETLFVSKVVGATLTVARGQLGTAAAPHASGLAVLKDLCGTDANYYSSTNGGPTLRPCDAAVPNDTNCYLTPYQGKPNRIQVRVRKDVPSYFAKAAFRFFGGGGESFRVAATAATTVGASGAPGITFAALNDGGNNCGENHSLIMRASGNLTVNNTVYVDSCNDHDGFDIKGGGGALRATKIYTVGGWEFEGNVTPRPEVWVGGVRCTLGDSGAHQFPAPTTGPGCPITGADPISDPLRPVPGPSISSTPACAEATVSNIIDKARASNVATLTTSSPHDLQVGDVVAITGVDSSFDSASATITQVPSPTTFKYANTGTPVPPYLSTTFKQLTSNVATITTSLPHGFVVGDSVTLKTGDNNIDGTFTVKDVPTATTFTYDKVHADIARAADVGPVGYDVTFKQLTSNVATITTASPHHLSPGDAVSIRNVDGTFNDDYVVKDVPSPTTFTYDLVHGNVARTAVTGGSVWGGPIHGSVTSTVHGTPTKPWACKRSSGISTLTPGTYYGGITIGTTTNGASDLCNTTTSASADVTMQDGIYILAGGGLKVCGSSSLHAAHVMIYNTQDPSQPTGNGALDQIIVNTTGSLDLHPMNDDGNFYKNLTIFQDPALALAAGTTCGSKTGFSTTPSQGQIDSWDIALIAMASTGVNGPLGSISGTVYAPKNHAEFAVAVDGTANLAVISNCILIDGSNSTFLFDASGIAGFGTSLTE